METWIYFAGFWRREVEVMTTHREPPPVIEGKKWSAVIVYGSPARFIERKEAEGVEDLYLWHDEHNLLCAAW